MSSSQPQIPDPLAIGDVHVMLPTADRAGAGVVYGLLLGEPEGDRWAASNATVGLVESGPLTVDLQVADLPGSVGLLRRRGLAVTDGEHGTAALDDAVPLRITDRAHRRPAARMLDHIVLTVGDADRALALFGGRLGINLRLVRDLGGGASQLFFRTTSAVIEVVTGTTDPADGIGLMGLAWRSDDIDVERARLHEAGLDVSEVRVGRKRGTRVCTLREPALGTATLLIQQ
ncbi:VOC family protein [Gordonia sp. (in: high G+C Gram-positive bacteria)]|uniref:VOC family protein n=1 Tax=Gordonia sp. (in: high G+C Gram-positive bacteria) TaxID=84139 RepID=UPI003C768714